MLSTRVPGERCNDMYCKMLALIMSASSSYSSQLNDATAAVKNSLRYGGSQQSPGRPTLAGGLGEGVDFMASIAILFLKETEAACTSLGVKGI